MWVKLAEVCGQGGTYGVIHWFQKLANARYGEGDDIHAHFSQMQRCVKELGRLSFNVPDNIVAALILNSLPDSFEKVASSIPQDSLTTSNVRRLVVGEYERQQGRKTTNSGDKALVGQSTGKYCTNCKGKTHNFNTCWSKGGGAEGQGPKKKKKKGENEKGKAKANAAKDDTDSNNEMSCFVGEKAFFADSASAYFAGVSTTTKSNLPDEDIALVARLERQRKFIIDSGTTTHLHPIESDFATLNTSNAQITGIGGSLTSKGRGTLSVLAKTNSKTAPMRIQLRDTLCTPKMDFSLISVSRLDLAGFRVAFSNKRCTITNKSSNKTVATATMRNRLYYLDLADVNPNSDFANLARPSSDLELWHQRLCHMNYRYVKALASKGLALGISISDASSSPCTCESCLKGKMHRLPFDHEGTRASKPLELVHCDLWGKCRTKSIGGSEYFISFTDDYSRYSDTYTLKAKSDAYSVLVIWHAEAERQTGKKLLTMRTDNGGEFVNGEWLEYFQKRGIVHQTTNPHTPQQNGVAERLNRTLIERVCACLYQADLQPRFWAEALNAVVYAKNRSPTVALKNMTPYEAWFGKKPDISNLRVFGCTCYVLIPASKRTKLEPKAFKAIFIGYPTGTKGWRFYNPVTQAIGKSRDIIFDERLTPSTSTTPIQLLEGEYRADLDAQLDMLDEASAERAPSPDQQSDDTPADLPDAPPEDPPDPEPIPPPNPPVPPPDPPRSTRPQRERKLPARFRDGATEEEIERAAALHAAENDLKQVLEEAINGECEEEDYAYFVALNDNPTFAQAMSSEDQEKWLHAMDQELNAIYGAGTFELVELPPGRKAIASKWVFRVKRDHLGAVTKYKARLVACGYTQVPGVDFFETFAPVARAESFRTLLALAAHFDWEIAQLDVKSAFLNGKLEEDIYMKPPKGFAGKGREHLVWKLLKTLYGLKQAGRIWYLTFRDGMLKLGYCPLAADSCIFFRISLDGKKMTIVAVHVDDMIVLSNSKAELERSKKEIGETFPISDGGEPTFLLGMHIERDRSKRTIKISQGNYVDNILSEFGMENCNEKKIPLPTGLLPGKTEDPVNEDRRRRYQKALGLLMYLACTTRPDLSHSVSYLSQFSSNPTEEHWRLVVHLLRYLKGTRDYCLSFGGSSTQPSIIAYSDADYAQNSDRKSFTGFVLKLSEGDSPVIWKSRKQTCVTTSTVESEYVAACTTSKDVVWLRLLLSELSFPQLTSTPLFIDNFGALTLTKDNTFHQRTKHIAVQYHFTREQVELGTIATVHVSSEENLADVFTKPLPAPRHLYMTRRLGLHTG